MAAIQDGHQNFELELNDKHIDIFIHSVYKCIKNESFLNDILMFLGITYVTLLTLLPKNHNIDSCCLLSMFPFIVFEVLINLIS